MKVVEEIADTLARETIAVMDELGDEQFYNRVSKVLVDISPTVAEVYLVTVRARIAERRGMRFLQEALARHRASKK